MPRRKSQLPADAKPGALRILRDGVFVAADVRKDMGDIVSDVDPKIAAQIVENGHGELL